MNDLDFIDRKKHTSTEAELIATNAIGAQNVYIINNIKSQQYISKSSQSAYLFDLERIELEKELKESDDYTKEILSQENSNYNSRLDYSIQNDFVEVDLCAENRTYKYKLWDGTKSSKIYLLHYNTDNNFCLYDIYIKIQKTSGEFTKKDLLKFVDFKLHLGIGGYNYTFQKDFFSICFFELMENQDILIEPNIIYLKAYTFQNMTYGIPRYFLDYHEVIICSKGLDSKTHSDFTIDIISSGKNIANIKSKHMDKYACIEEKVILSKQSEKEKIFSGLILEIFFNHLVSILMFFLYDNYDEPDSDELESPDINAIGLIFNNPNSTERIWWESNEIIKINFMGIILCVVPIDPALRDYKKFYNYVNNKADFTQLKSINFSRIDKIYATIEYDNNKKYNLYMNGLHTNMLRIMSGMAGLAFST